MKVHAPRFFGSSCTQTTSCFRPYFASTAANSPLWNWTPFLATTRSDKKEAVLDRIPRMELAADETYERVDFFMMRGPKHMKVVF